MKKISEIIKESDAYKQLKKRGLIVDDKFHAKNESQLDILFQSFGSMYKEMYNNKNKNNV